MSIHKAYRNKKRDRFFRLLRSERYFIAKVQIASKIIAKEMIKRGFEMWPLEKSPYSESVYLYLKKLDHPTKNYIKIRISCHSIKNDNSDISIYV